MAIIQPTSFAQLMQRAPVLREQGGRFGRIPGENAATVAGLVGGVMGGKFDLEIARRQGENALAQIEAQRKSTFGDRLRLMAPLLAGGLSSGGLFGGGGGTRMAGSDLFATLLLQQGSVSPNALIGNANDMLAGMNLFRAQGPEAWTASSRKGTQSILPWMS